MMSSMIHWLDFSLFSHVIVSVMTVTRSDMSSGGMRLNSITDRSEVGEDEAIDQGSIKTGNLKVGFSHVILLC